MGLGPAICHAAVSRTNKHAGVDIVYYFLFKLDRLVLSLAF